MKADSILKSIAWTFLYVCTSTFTYAQMALTPELASSETTPAPESSTHNAATERNFYVKVYGYYGLLSPGGFGGQGVGPTNTYSYSSGGTYYTNTLSNSNYKTKDAFGAGLRVGGGLGYVINDFINIGIDGEYVVGKTTSESYDITSETATSGSTVKSVNYTANVQRDYSYRIVNIIPNITFKAVAKPEYYIYNRLGIIIGIPTELSYVSTSVYAYPDNPTSRYEIQDYHDLQKNIGLGYQAALGIQFRIGDNLRGFTEIVVSNVQFKSDTDMITKGQYSYTDANTSQLNQPIDYDESTKLKKDLNLNVPVSSIGISAGIALRF